LMIDLPKDFKEFLQLLGDHCVEYVIVDAYAVAYHGHPRATGDLDILVMPDRENAGRLLKAIEEFGMGSLGLAVEDFSQPGRVCQLGMPPLRIDLLTSVDGVSNEEIMANRQAIQDGKLKLYFIGCDEYNHPIPVSHGQLACP